MKHFFSRILLVCILFASKPFLSQTVTLLSEDFSSNTFTTNGWNFPNGQSPWSVNSFYTPTAGAVPNALCFIGSVSLSNYSIPMVSGTINATGVTGPVFFSCVIRLQNSTTNATGLERLDVQYKDLASSTWTTIITYSNSVPGNNQNFAINNYILSGMSGQNFQIRFNAYGSTSTHMAGWGIDNILVNGVTCPSSLPALSITASPTLCAGSTATITATGGGPSYTWAPGGELTSSIVVTPTSTSSYALLSSYPGCTTSAVSGIVTITVVPNPSTLIATASSASLCSGNSVSLTASGASTYTWSTGTASSSIVVSPSVNTIYTISSTNSINCVNTATLGITVQPTPTVSIFSSTNTICSGSSANLIASGAPSFSWNTGGSNAIYPVFPLVTTTYVATGSSSVGCSSSASYVVFVSPTVVALASSSAICAGNSATLSASSALTYTWNGSTQASSIVITPLSTSIQSVSATNTMGCISTQTLQLLVHPNPTVTASSSASAICVGASGILSASGASTYSWSTGSTSNSITVSPGSTTLYTVSGISAEGCTGANNTASINLIVHNNPVVTASALPGTLCAGKSATLSATGAFTYSWISGPATNSMVVNAQQSTLYTVVGTDANLCSDSGSVFLSVYPNPSLSIVASATNVCSGASVTLLGGGASTYTWNSAITQQVLSFVATSSSTQTLMGTDLNGCIGTETLSILVNPNPTIMVIASNTSICSGSGLQLQVSGASSYSWNTNQTAASITVSPAQSFSYSVVGSDVNNCSDTAGLFVLVNASPVLTLSSTASVICVGESSNLFVAGASSYVWSNGMSNDSITVFPTQDSSFVVQGTALNGCSASASLLITVDACAGISETFAENKLSIYPNPTSGTFQVKGDGLRTLRSVTIIDVSGKMLLSRITPEAINQLDVSALPPGVYIVNLNTEQGRYRLKLMKQ